MKKISFTIQGNHKDPYGNPLPKLKMTGKQRWMPKAQEYGRWKQHVKGCFLSELVDEGLLKRADFRDLIYVHEDLKPIVKSKKPARMEIMIWWCSDVHGDPENIFGSIADALFENDKYLAGSFDFAQSPNKKARVDVTITLSE